MKKIALFLLALFLIPSATAGFFDDIFDPIQDFFDDLTDDIRDELDRTRVGRELNRVIEDLEAVAHIVNDFDDILSMAASATTPIGLIDLAVRYGHDPDQVFGRWQERVDTLGGQGSLSATETAAALQSVLEEPPLPDGVYMGDGCVVDLTQCPETFVRTDTGATYRASFWEHSCYLNGVVGKLKLHGRNKAACEITFTDAHNRRITSILYPANQSEALYGWQACGRVILLKDEQRAFLSQRDQVCEQPISNYNLGDVCVVDYTTCSYGQSIPQFNANRVGTIVEGSIFNRELHISEYSCDTIQGNFALRKSLRRDCEHVYAGQSEVQEYLNTHPEPTIQAPPPREKAPVQNTSGVRLGDLGALIYQPTYAFGREGVVALQQDVQVRKQQVSDQLVDLGVVEEVTLDPLFKASQGKYLPGPLAKLFGEEYVVLHFTPDYGKDQQACFTIIEGQITEANYCDDADPTLILYVTQTALTSALSEDKTALRKAIDDGAVTWEGVGFFKRMKFKALGAVAKEVLV